MEHFPSGNLTIMEQITSKREKNLDQAHMRNKITTTNGIGFYLKWNKKIPVNKQITSAKRNKHLDPTRTKFIHMQKKITTKEHDFTLIEQNNRNHEKNNKK
jgi:hypothetical protein